MPMKIARFMGGLNFADGTPAPAPGETVAVQTITKIAAIIIMIILFIAAVGIAVYYYTYLHDANLPGLVYVIISLVGGWALQNLGLSAGATLFQNALQTGQTRTTTTTTAAAVDSSGVSTPHTIVVTTEPTITATNKTV